MPLTIEEILEVVAVVESAHSFAHVETGEEILHADINATASGDTTVVAASNAAEIRVLSVCFTVSAAVAVAWKSGSATTKIAAMSFPTEGGMNQDYRRGWFVETDMGESLVINLSGNANVRGIVNYILKKIK